MLKVHLAEILVEAGEVSPGDAKLTSPLYQRGRAARTLQFECGVQVDESFVDGAKEMTQSRTDAKLHPAPVTICGRWVSSNY